MSIFRGFIAIDIVSFPKLIQFESEIKNTGANIKLVEPENIHITLKFLGETKENHINQIEQFLKESAQGLEPFEIQLKGSGVFPNPNYIKVIWIGIRNGDIIGKIANKIDEKISTLGFKKENRNFSPHLTIARVKSAANKDKLIRLIYKIKK